DGCPGQQRLEQVGELGSAQSQVPAVVSQVLSYQVDLLRTLRLKRLRLAHQTLERLGAMLPAHQRDGAEGARVVAALGDLEIANVACVTEELADARMGRQRVVDQPPLGERRHQVMQIRKPEKQVDLRDFPLQLLLVPLDEA